MDINSAIEQVESGRHLSIEEMQTVMGRIMDGRCDESQIARLLIGLHDKGETVEEVAGAAAAMRKQMTPIRSAAPDCSTPAAPAATARKPSTSAPPPRWLRRRRACPWPNTATAACTSRSGSADVLAALGVNIEADVACVEACLDELGICFCFAPLLHTAMKHVAPVRKKLGTPTIFNILGPLVNPASAPFQLLGVGRADCSRLWPKPCCF